MQRHMDDDIPALQGADLPGDRPEPGCCGLSRRQHVVREGTTDGEAAGTGLQEPGEVTDGHAPGEASSAGYGHVTRRRRRLAVAVVASAVLGSGIGGVVGAWMAADRGPGPAAVVTAPVPAKGQPHGGDARVAAQALRGTVTIKTEGAQGNGIGTGFVFDREGHILTNAHVVEPVVRNGKLMVTLSDGTTYPGSLVGVAKGYDIAVVKLDNAPAGGLVPLPLGNSDQVVVGEPVIAAGAPFDLEGTITSGIISAKNRPVASGTTAQRSYMNALQTDASINPGNSGGPLLNSAGAVIGVNSAIRSASPAAPGAQSGSIGLGFAIPINQAAWVAKNIIEHGHPVYAQLGILPNENYPGDGAQIMPTPVAGTPPITPKSPAAKAGLKPGDVITTFNGTPVTDVPTLLSQVWAHRPGDTVDVRYARGGTTHTARITLGELQGDRP